MDKLLLVFVMLFICLPLAAVLHGYTIATLWEWFIHGTFGLPLITKAQGYGLGLFVGYLLIGLYKFDQNEDKDSTEKLTELFGKAFFVPVFILGIGYIVKHYFM